MNDYLTRLKSSLDGEVIDDEIVEKFYAVALKSPSMLQHGHRENEDTNGINELLKNELLKNEDFYESMVNIDHDLYDNEIIGFTSITREQINEINQKEIEFFNYCLVKDIEVELNWE